MVILVGVGVGGVCEGDDLGGRGCVEAGEPAQFWDTLAATSMTISLARRRHQTRLTIGKNFAVADHADGFHDGRVVARSGLSPMWP